MEQQKLSFSTKEYLQGVSEMMMIHRYFLQVTKEIFKCIYADYMRFISAYVIVLEPIYGTRVSTVTAFIHLKVNFSTISNRGKRDQ